MSYYHVATIEIGSIRTNLLYNLSNQPYLALTNGICSVIHAFHSHFQKQRVARDLLFPSSCIKQTKNSHNPHDMTSGIFNNYTLLNVVEASKKNHRCRRDCGNSHVITDTAPCSVTTTFVHGIVNC